MRQALQVMSNTHLIETPHVQKSPNLVDFVLAQSCERLREHGR
jgi:hypothetical protein